MSRIDFYVLSDQAPDSRLLLACRLSEKAFSLGHKVYVQTVSAEQAQRLDDLLWTFRQNSFVPHALWPPEADDESPVLIGWGESASAVTADVLINLSHEIPPDFERFGRVLEIADQEPATLAQSRQRFRYYRERGYPPETHKL